MENVASTKLHIKNADYKIDFGRPGGGMWVEKSFYFEGGERVNFEIRVTGTSEMTLVDVHRQSLEKAIQYLQKMLDPELCPTLRP